MPRETHGMSKTQIYSKWLGIRKRCLDKKRPRYGGRGISVCDEWMNSFPAFFEWAMKNGYQDGLTIDRIDNDGDYCPENCRWVSVKAQANNRSTNIVFEYNGEERTLKSVCEELGLNYHTIYCRVKRDGVPIDRAIKEKDMTNRNFFTINGETKTIRGWCLHYGVEYKSVWYRMKRMGLSLEEALNYKKWSHPHK